MAQIEKLLDKLLRKPSPKDFTWTELQKLLGSFGYTEKKGKGSRRKFYKEDDEHMVPIMLHEPHPEKTINPVYIKDIKQALKDNGDIEWKT